MSHGKRAGALVGLLVASLVAGAVVGVAGASPAEGAAADRTAGLVATNGDAAVLQSANNESTPVANTTVAHDGDRVTLVAAAGERIEGETDLEPGTTLTLRVESKGQSPFLVRGQTTVQDDGTFNGTVDLSRVQANATATVLVRNGSTTLAKVDAEVVRCTENCSSPEEWPEFDRGVVTGRINESVDVAVDVPEGHDGPVNVTVGSDDDGFVVETTIDDANDDDSIVLTVDTERAGNGLPGEYLSAGDDEIVAVQERSENASPSLKPGHYDLTVGPTDAPYDVGTLALNDPVREESNENETTDEEDAPEIDVNTTGEVTFITAGDTLKLGNADDQTIRAETELEPGSTVALWLESEEASDPFLFTPEATVTEYGTLNATVDLRRTSPDTHFQLVARHDGEAVGATVGRIVECDDNCSAVASGGKKSGSAANASDGEQKESNVVDVNEQQIGGVPVEGVAAIGVGGVLALVGLGYFTGRLKG